MKKVLILGASSGIAFELIRIFANLDYELTLTVKNFDALIELKYKLAEELAYTNPDIKVLNVLDYNSVCDFYNAKELHYDVVICCIGYLGDQAEAQANPLEASKIIKINYANLTYLFEAIAADFEQRKQGTLIVVSSVAGDRGRQSNYIYGSAKAGLTAYLSGLRQRLAKVKVNVLTVKPGFVDTKMIAGKKTIKALTAKPEVVARSIYNAYLNQRNVIYTPFYWRYILLILKLIPEWIYKKLKV